MKKCLHLVHSVGFSYRQVLLIPFYVSNNNQLLGPAQELFSYVGNKM